MKKNDYKSLKQRIAVELYHQIVLPPDEYAMVMSAFNTHMSDEERTHKIVTKAIDGNVYTIINNGFDDYIIIGKYPIDETYGMDWEIEE